MVDPLDGNCDAGRVAREVELVLIVNGKVESAIRNNGQFSKDLRMARLNTATKYASEASNRGSGTHFRFHDSLGAHMLSPMFNTSTHPWPSSMQEQR